MKTQSPDTSVEEERRRIEFLRAMPAGRKVELACQLGELELAVLWVRVRMELLGAPQEELEREFLSRCWGTELADNFLKDRAERAASKLPDAAHFT